MKREEIDNEPRTIGRGMKGARMCAEQKERIRRGVQRWFQNLTPGARDALSAARRDIAICTVHRPRPRLTRPFAKGNTLGSKNSLSVITDRKRLAVSVKRIMRDLVDREPHLVEEGLRRGLQADPPRSYPYLALAASYIDGRPPEQINIEANVQTQASVELSRLSNSDLQTLRLLQLKMLGSVAAAGADTIDIRKLDE
jgi:hypothetical protein